MDEKRRKQKRRRNDPASQANDSTDQEQPLLGKPTLISKMSYFTASASRRLTFMRGRILVSNSGASLINFSANCSDNSMPCNFSSTLSRSSGAMAKMRTRQRRSLFAISKSLFAASSLNDKGGSRNKSEMWDSLPRVGPNFLHILSATAGTWMIIERISSSESDPSRRRSAALTACLVPVVVTRRKT